MIHFCLDCWNQAQGTHYDEWDYIISKEVDLCDECLQYKHVIVKRRFPYLRYMFPRHLLPIEWLCRFLIALVREFTRIIWKTIRYFRSKKQPPNIRL